MTIFYSSEHNGFYDPEIHGENIPSGSVEITPEQHQELLEFQSLGMQISSNAEGFPIAIDRPALSEEELNVEFNADIIRQIETIEREKQPRAMRDFLLNEDKTRLEELNTEINDLRAQLK